MFSRSIHTVTKGKNFFFYNLEFHCVNVPWLFYPLIYLLMDTGCFHVLEIINNAAMDIGVLMFSWTSVLSSFGYMSRSGISGSKGRIIFNFFRYLCTSFHSICSSLHSHQHAKVFPLLHILASTCFLIYWWQPFWKVWDGISLWFLICHFSNN